MTSVLVVDDHRLFADALCAALAAEGMHVIGPATTGASAIELAERERPDVVLLDLGLPDRSGVEVADDLRRANPETRLIGMSGSDDAGLVGGLKRAGFHGFVPKRARLKQILRSLSEPERAAASWPSAPVPRTTGTTPGIELLTRRELEVLRLLDECGSGAEVARRLSIAPNTVRSHIQSILEKLQVHSRLAAVALLAESERDLRTP